MKIEFDSDEALKHFARWLCGSGEASYWIWMECREEEEEGDVTALSFDYHQSKKFMANNKIIAGCGRMDDERE